MQIACSYRIVLIGAGNVATRMGKALKKAGHIIAQVYSRTERSAQALAQELDSSFTTSLNELSNADLYIVAVKDDALPGIASQIKVKGIIVHTCGSIDMQVLKDCSKSFGVLYPLQTFSKSKDVDFSKVPFCIEASSDTARKIIENAARSISGNIHRVNSEQRRVLHLSAVFACNFTNHMFTIAEDILKKENIPFDILLPLIEETVDKVKHNSPREMQTGPARRNDAAVMQKHLEMLKDDDKAQELYRMISESILGAKSD